MPERRPERRNRERHGIFQRLHAEMLLLPELPDQSGRGRQGDFCGAADRDFYEFAERRGESQYLPWVTAALDAARAQGFSLPVVYNTGGYETVDAVKALAGYVDIWLADYKYADGALAAELSAARDYPAVADAALRQMLLQTGAPVYDADGYLQKGVIVRHLALPGHVADSKAVLRRLAALREETGVEFIPSLMSQFTPFYKAAEHGLGRRITTYEYRQVIDEAVRLGLTDGYMQEKSSAREEYTPPFDLEGV